MRNWFCLWVSLFVLLGIFKNKTELDIKKSLIKKFSVEKLAAPIHQR